MSKPSEEISIKPMEIYAPMQNTNQSLVPYDHQAALAQPIENGYMANQEALVSYVPPQETSNEEADYEQC